MSRVSVIIDTDFGRDPGSMLALYYALKSPEIKIKAIITSDEYRIDHRAAVLKKWLISYGANIPVFAGIDSGDRKSFYLMNYFSEHIVTEKIIDSGYIHGLLEYVAGNKGYYVSLGGLTNLKYLFAKYKNNIRDLKIYAVGGTLNSDKQGSLQERNITLDLEAASYIFQSELNINLLLSDQTAVEHLEVSKGHELYYHIKKHDNLFFKIIKENMDSFYMKTHKRSYLSNSLAISSIFLDTVSYTKRKVVMEEGGVFNFSEDGVDVNLSSGVRYDVFWTDFNNKVLEY